MDAKLQNPVNIQIGNEMLVLHRQSSSVPSPAKNISAAKPSQATITFNGNSIPSLSLFMPPPPPPQTNPAAKKKSPARKKISKGPSTPKEQSLPQARIRVIMKTAANVSFLSQEAVAIATKAAEMFIKKLVKETRSMQQDPTSEGGRDIDYVSLVRVVKTSKKLQFLKEFLPPKISVKEYLKLTGHSIPEKPLNDDSSRTIADKSNTNNTITI